MLNEGIGWSQIFYVGDGYVWSYCNAVFPGGPLYMLVLLLPVLLS